MKTNVTHIDFLNAIRQPGSEEETAPYSEKDYTHEVIEFLRSVHGNIRVNEDGDYYYGKVSTISLHFLLNSSLPPKEVLWGWYDYFDRERSESIYQTLPPLRDEAFLRVLHGCGFPWDPVAVRDSGLVFLSHHRNEVYLALEDFLTQRLEHHRDLEDAALREFLTPRNTYSEVHLRRQVRQLKTRPLSREERQEVYRRFGSDYLKATARQLVDEAAGEPFWKKPPPELEPLGARFKALTTAFREEAIRLGVYVTRDAYQRAGWQDAYGRAGGRDDYGRAGGRDRSEGGQRGRRRASGGHHFRPAPSGVTLSQHFAVLGLSPSATLDDVKAAYREKVKAYHPDQGGSVPEFIRLQEAYEVLLTDVF